MKRVRTAAKAVWTFASRKDLRPAELVLIRALAAAGGLTAVVKFIDLLPR